MNTFKESYHSISHVLSFTKCFAAVYNSEPGSPSLFYSEYKRHVIKKAVVTFVTLCLLVLLQSSCARTERSLSPQTDQCPLGNAIQSDDGIYRLAMIVGVGQYLSPNIPDLPGPSEDAKRFYELLTGPQGYGFPKENVCLILDEDATTKNFINKFEKSLTNRARPKDEIVIYYAGHGSQTKDLNADEQDGMDETFVFHDARNAGVKDFLDDEFDRLITNLYSKSKRITVFLDSCNSGSAMRGDTEFLSRYLPPVQERLTDPALNFAQGKKKQTGWISNSLPGVVFFTAAGDGTSALEKNARGIFTDALLTALSDVGRNKPTYAQVARQIRPLVKAESYQIPYFQGDLLRYVFSGSNRDRPLSWEVIEVEPQLKLAGFPLPGIGKGAEFRVYSGSARGAVTQDPAKAKALIILDESTGLNATARISSKMSNAESIHVGDLAVLARPGDEQRLLKVTLRSMHLTGGISAVQAEKLAVEIKTHNDAGTMVSLVKNQGDFEVSYEKGTYLIRGPENTIRSRFAKESQVIENLRLHALQRVLISLRGEGADMFTDHDSLQLQIVPAKKQNQCAQGANWHQVQENALSPQKIPLCYKWNVKVRLKQNSTVRLLIGGLILSTDGSIFGFPADGTAVALGPGEEVVFAGANETFVGAPPLNIEDQIIVFGTQENNPVPWSKLTQSIQPGSASRGANSGLFRILDRYISGTRGVGIDQPVEVKNKDLAWTLSSISMRVVDK